MANIIIDAFGREALISDIGNPFAFFGLYNEAAEHSEKSCYLFSESTMNYFSYPEDKYTRK